MMNTLELRSLIQRLPKGEKPAAEQLPEINAKTIEISNAEQLSELTEKLTAFLCRKKGIDPAGADLIPMEQYRQQQFDLLADGVRAALDLPAVYAAMGLAGPKGENA